MADGLKGVMDLAAASGAGLGETSDIVTDSIENFGLTAADTEHYVNVLAQTSRKSNTDVLKLGESYKYVSPVAKAMGYSLEDVNVALGLMANSGIKASQSGTSLRTLLTNMAKPTDTMAAAMKTLGVSLDDGQGNMKTFYEIMLDLRKGFGDLKMPQDEFQKQMKKLSDGLNDGTIKSGEYDKAVMDLIERAYGAEGALKAQAAASLAGKEGMSGLLAIVNASDETFNQLVADINNADGAFFSMQQSMDSLQAPTQKQLDAITQLDIKTKDSEGNLLSYSQILGQLKDSFGEMQMPAEQYASRLEKLQKSYSKGKSTQAEFNKGIKELMKDAYGAEGGLKAQAAATILGKDNMGKFAESLGMTSEEFLKFAQSVETSKGAAAEMADIMNDNLKGQLTIFGSAMEDLKLEIYTHFQDGATEMVKVGQEYVNHITAGMQENGVQGMFDALSDVLSDVLTRVIEFLPQMVTFGIELLKMLATALAENAPIIATALQDMLVIVLDEIGKAVPILQPLTDAITEFITHLEEFKPVLEGVAAGIAVFVAGLAAMKAIQQISDIANKVKTALSGLFTVMAANPIMLVVAAIGLLVAAFVTLWNKSEAFRNFWKGLWEKIKQIAEPVIKAVKENMVKAWDAIKEAWDKVQPYFEKLWETIKTIWDKAKPFFTTLFNAIKDIVTTVWNGIKQIIGNAWTHVKNIWDKAKPFFTSLFNAIKEVVSTVWTIVSDLITGAWKKIQPVWEKAKPFFNAIWEVIKAAVKTVKNVLVNSFETAWSLIEGVWGAVTAYFTGIFDAIKGIFKTIKALWKGDFEGAKNAIVGVFSGIKDTFFKIAGNIIDGLKNGIKNGINTVKNAVSDVANGIKNGFKSILGIKSPSKVFRTYGNYILEGLNKGIDDKSKGTREKMKKLAKDLSDDTKKILKESAAQLEDINKKHAANLKKIESDYKKEIKNLKGEYEKEVEGLNYDHILKLGDITKEYATTLENLQKQEAQARADADAQNKDALLKIEQDYASTLANIEQQQTEFSKKIVNFAGLLGAPSEETVISNEQVVENARAQTAKVQKYAAALEKLKAMNLPDEILQQFIEMGAGSADQLEEFSNMTNEQLQAFLGAYQERKQIADKIAADNFNNARLEAERQYQEQKAQQEKHYKDQLWFIQVQFNLQRKQADNDYKRMKKDEQRRYDEALKTAKLNYQKQKSEALKNYNDLVRTENMAFEKDLENLQKLVNKKMKKIGTAMKQGIIAGATVSRQEAMMFAENLTDGMVDMVRQQLGIASPSKVFAKIGDYCIQGFEQPFKNYKATAVLADAINGQIRFDTSQIDKLLNLNNAGQTLSELRAAAIAPITYDNREEINNSPTLNFYDTQTTPSAIYRKFRKTMTYGLARGV